jgi:hypothetical protein
MNNQQEQNLRDSTALGRPLELKEVDALIRYAAEHGLDPKGEILPELNEKKTQWEADLKDPDKYKEVLRQYTVLAARTAPISGRILLDSEDSGRRLRWLVVTTVILIIIAAGDGVLRLWELEWPTPGDQKVIRLIHFSLDYLNPFVWGALGACVYLLKRLYDLAAAHQFDAVLYCGWWIRLVLGAVLGGVVIQIFDFTGGEGAIEGISKTALAFLTGLGVRVVYGAFERTVELLAEKMNLGAVRREKPVLEDSRSILSRQLARTDPAREPDKHRALLELLSELNGEKDKKRKK